MPKDCAFQRSFLQLVLMLTLVVLTPAKAQSGPTAAPEPGLFPIQLTDGKLLIEIPPALLNQELFWYAEAGRLPDGGARLTGMRLGSAVVKFQLRKGTVLLRLLTYQKREDIPETNPHEAPHRHSPITLATRQAEIPPAIAAFQVIRTGSSGGPVIDATSLFTTNRQEMSAQIQLVLSGLKAFAQQPDLQFIKQVRAFPDNLRVKAFQTYSDGTKTVSLVVEHSLTKLPEEKMRPRIFDHRIGYFTTDYSDYSVGEANRVVPKKIILRHRLEKRNPKLKLSEPVEPIVYYIDHTVPEKWRPYFKLAVEDWNVAFEEAGFKNAVVAKMAPNRKDWSAADSRYNVIRWIAEPVANAQGPNIHDPRTGEIISAHVVIWANVGSLIEQWYSAQCGHLDPSALKPPYSRELMGEMMRYAVAHEVGHSLGLRHNHRASTGMSIDELRDPAYQEKWGPVASIMSYGRFNYVARSGDGVKRLFPKISHYDLHAIKWGYAEIPEAKSARAEVPILSRWASLAEENNKLLFGGEDERALTDPRVLTQNIGSDRIGATRAGLDNLDILVGRLKNVEHNEFFPVEEMYTNFLAHRGTWLSSVAKLLGGVVEERTLAGTSHSTFVRVSSAKQKKAVQFLLQRGFQIKEDWYAPEILNQVRNLRATSQLRAHQDKLLGEILSPRVYQQLFDAAVIEDDSYSILSLFREVQRGIWEEAYAGRSSSPLRRSLQRSHLELLRKQLMASGASAAEAQSEMEKWSLDSASYTDFRAALKTSLGSLRVALEDAVSKSGDAISKAHYQESLNKVRVLLAL